MVMFVVELMRMRGGVKMRDLEESLEIIVMQDCQQSYFHKSLFLDQDCFVSIVEIDFWLYQHLFCWFWWYLDDHFCEEDDSKYDQLMWWIDFHFWFEFDDWFHDTNEKEEMNVWVERIMIYWDNFEWEKEQIDCLKWFEDVQFHCRSWEQREWLVIRFQMMIQIEKQEVRIWMIVVEYRWRYQV